MSSFEQEKDGLGRSYPAVPRSFRVAGWMLGAVVLMIALPGAWMPDAVAAPLEEKVVRAVQGTYIHGVTEDIARQEVGAEGVPVLLQLLADATFSSRDNVVAFLAHLGGPETTPALLNFLKGPPASVTIPEEDRALLLAPQALGRIASRGDPAALQALIAMTAPDAKGGILSMTAARGANPPSLRDDLLEMALRGLAFSRATEARGRLSEIAKGRVTPVRGGRNLAPAATSALALFDSLTGAVNHNADQSGLGATDAAASTDAIGNLTAAATDPAATAHDHGLNYSNHVDLADPMSDARLDQLLSEGSLRVGQDNFTEDVACCVTSSRLGTGATFGSPGDGLDVIDNSTETFTVLTDPSARIKVARLINYCGGPGNNIIGCGIVNGNGIIVVRMSDIGMEAVLWIHEYGHNIGLGHNRDSRYIMHGIDFGTNNGINPNECDMFHNPSSLSEAQIVATGTCTNESCGNGLCDIDESCSSCPADCPSVSATCGNGICEAGDGEDCLSCASDCRGKQKGNPSKGRFCCGDGDGENPLACSDPACTSSGYQCTDTPATPSCCGDLICQTNEDGYNCATDCGPPPPDPFCGDGTCDANEDSCVCSADCGAPPVSEISCIDGIDNDCDLDIDCADLDCNISAACQCVAKGGACSIDVDCCSSKCRGKAGAKRCK